MSKGHRCHAIGCRAIIPPKLLMCRKHWKMVPRPMQEEVWKYYRKGQETDKTPSSDWVTAAQNAIDHVHQREKFVDAGGRLIKMGEQASLLAVKPGEGQ